MNLGANIRGTDGHVRYSAVEATDYLSAKIALEKQVAEGEQLLSFVRDD
jgi:hypothetical protein